MRVAVIGAGKQGGRHLAALAAIPAVTSRIVADLDPERADAAAARWSAIIRPSAEAVFADAAIDAVVITTPTSTQGDLAAAAIAAGKHVLCEKPVGADAQTGKRLARAAAASGLVARAGYLYRFAPSIMAARCCLDGAATNGVSRALGRIVSARLAIAAPGGHAVWKHRRDSGGGVVNELVSHMLDLALWCFGPAQACDVRDKRLTAPRRSIAGRAYDVDAADRIAIVLRVRPGVTVDITADFAAARFAQSLDIVGENGHLAASITPHFPGFIELNAARAGRSARRHPLPGSAPDAIYRAQARSFIAAIEQGQAVPREGCGLVEAAEVSAWLETLNVAPIAIGRRSAA